MADDSEDPDIKAGREIATGGKKAAAAPATVDPDVAAGAKIANAPPPATTTTTTTADGQPSWTGPGVARNVAAGAAVDAPSAVVNFLSDPSYYLVRHPLAVAAGTAYDFVAPMLGLDRMTPEQRADLYGQPQPGQTQLPPEQQPIGTRVVNALDASIPGPTAATLPATPTEQYARSATGGALTAGVLGGPAAILPGAAATITGNIASDYAPDWLKPGAELIGNIAGAKLGSTATNIGTKAVNAATGATTPITAAYDELGIDKSLVGDVSGSPTARLVQAYGSKSPFGSSVVNPIEQKVVGQFNNAVEDTASRLGTSTSEQTAGEALQREARNWKDTVFPQREAQAWAPVDQLLGNETVAPNNYRAALTSLTSKLSGLPDTAKVLVPQRTWDMLDAINKDVPAGQSMPWQQAQALRTAIGQVMGVPEIVQALGKDQLKRAYGGISQDMQDTAAAVDARNAAATPPGTAAPPSAVGAFNNANRVSTEGHAFIDGPLSKIIKSNNPAQDKDPELATRSVLGSTDTTLEAIRREMPKAADELAAYKLRDMALATPGAAGRTGQETSVGTFLTDLNRMRQQTPAGFRALYSDPTVARKIDALATVADTMKETARRANVSGTGPYLALGETGSAAVATWLATHSPTATALAVGGPFVVNRAAGYAATNPLVARMAAAPGPRNLPNPLFTGAVVNQLQQNRRTP